jgi:hypothetical protein
VAVDENDQVAVRRLVCYFAWLLGTTRWTATLNGWQTMTGCKTK